MESNLRHLPWFAVKRILLAATALTLTLSLDANALAVPRPPMVLPSEASTASVGTWLIGVRPGARARRIITGDGGRQILPGAFEVPRGRARALARKLTLTYAEPNRPRAYTAERAVPDDPLSPKSRWRDAAIDPSLAPPPVTSGSPLLALVDSKPRLSHPEFAGANVSSLPGGTVGVSHGTETLGVAVAPQNGVGIVGTYPGARATNVALPNRRIGCADSARGIRRAVRTGAAVINMSYGSTAFCQTEYQALQLATHRNITLVAAGGNERADGNPYEFPASLPHVLTVGALTPQNHAAFFSNTSAALDLVAPGVGIIAPLPEKFDTEDDGRDGYEVVDGTSFAAPIVSAAAIWIRTVRPELTVDQVAQTIRLSATDITRHGWDKSTGYGKLNLAAALVATPPPPDPLEPNEDFRFVDGRAFGHKAAPIWRGGAAAHLTALLDLFEDPSDVYRLRIPAHRRATITVKPEFGNADVDVYAGGAPSIASDRGLLRRSQHPGKHRERVTIRNRSGRTRTAQIQVYVRDRKPLDCRYTLTVR
ncbi:MAG: hypothetical protein QOI80_1796 [Solirubrobacteraceae bacterium]|nr:hypothetical protein [Solirubrobacteraceae bacterium]